MKGGDLVVVQIGGDEGLRGEVVFQLAHVTQIDPAGLHVRLVGREILAHRAEGHRLAAEQLEVVADVARAAAELATHLRHVEGHAEHVHLVRQDVILELILEHHDGVVSERAADQGAHVFIQQWSMGFPVAQPSTATGRWLTSRWGVPKGSDDCSKGVQLRDRSFCLEAMGALDPGDAQGEAAIPAGAASLSRCGVFGMAAPGADAVQITPV